LSVIFVAAQEKCAAINTKRPMSDDTRK